MQTHRPLFPFSHPTRRSRVPSCGKRRHHGNSSDWVQAVIPVESVELVYFALFSRGPKSRFPTFSRLPSRPFSFSSLGFGSSRVILLFFQFLIFPHFSQLVTSSVPFVGCLAGRDENARWRRTTRSCASRGFWPCCTWCSMSPRPCAPPRPGAQSSGGKLEF